MAGSMTNRERSCFWCGFSGLCMKDQNDLRLCKGKCEKYKESRYGKERQTTGQSDQP